MGLDFYRFHSVWTAPVSPARAFEVLADLGNYPKWWPEIREIWRVAEDCAELICRSVLPYDLRFRAAHSVRDEYAGRLRATLTGDLDGFASWSIVATEAGSTLLYDQEVVLRKPLLRRLAPLLRPVMRANHEVMMRHGQRGLLGYLAG